MFVNISNKNLDDAQTVIVRELRAHGRDCGRLNSAGGCSRQCK